MISLDAIPSQKRPYVPSPIGSGSTFLTHASLVQPFKYWHEGLHEGIFYRGDLYGKAGCYALTERDHVFDVAAQHTALGKSVCITVSGPHYILWVSLRGGGDR